MCTLVKCDVWWNNVIMRSFTLKDWLQNFRMCKETFSYIYDRLSLELERSDSHVKINVCTKESECLSVVFGYSYRILHHTSFVWHWLVNCL